jgi:hypothetical protein
MQTQNSLRRNAETLKDDAKVQEFRTAHKAVLLPYLQCILLDGFKTIKEYGYTDFTLDSRSLEKRFNSQGMGFIQTSLPNLFNGLTTHLETGVSSYPEFKLQKGTSHPRFLRKLFVLIFNAHTATEIQAQAFRVIYQLCAAFSKLEGPYPTSVLRKELANFVEVDAKLGKCCFNTPDLQPIFRHARSCITQIFNNYTGFDEHELPCPGSGATNVPVGKDLRYRPHFLYKQLHEVYDHDIWFNTFYQYLFGGEAVDYAARLLELMDFAEYPTSRFKFIQKKLGKPRGICIEENEAQIFQQGLRRFLYWCIESHAITSGKVNFTNQETNRMLALLSSLDRTYATIDMSEASDRVDRELVLALFLFTNLFDKLNAVSTKFIQLPTGLGQNPTMKVHKFAPMGSGVCFPIEGIVFWALIQGIIHTSTIPDSAELCKEVYVYGDDIIVPSCVAELVMTTLPRFGMKINKEKSFVNSYFRESCGCHAYKGIDITPTFFKKAIINSSKPSDSTLLISLISKEQRLTSSGFHVTAEYLRSKVHDLFGLIPIVHEDSCLVGWKTTEAVPVETLMPFCKGVKRLERDPQQKLYKFRIKVADIQPLPDLQDDRGYWRKQTMLTRDSRVVSGEPEDTRILWSWVPEPALSSDPEKIGSLLTQKSEQCEPIPDGRMMCILNHHRGVIMM